MLAALLLVGASLGLDNFAASIALGMSGVDRRVRARVALAFGLFEAGMPIVGVLTGRGLSNVLGSSAHIIGGLLLIAVGAEAAVAWLRSGDCGAGGGAGGGGAVGGGAGGGEAGGGEAGGGGVEGVRSESFTTARTWRLLLLAAALSIDNLVVGFALGADHTPLVLSVFVIGLVSVAMSLVGLEVGARLGDRVGRYAELTGSIVLIVVGLAIATKVM